MAQVLVKNKAATGGPSDFQLDDIVMVAEDSHQWGSAELDPTNFRIISVPGSRSEYVKYIEPMSPSLRSVFPRSMLALNKVTPEMIKIVRQAPNKTARLYFLDAGNAITRKIIED